MDRKMDRLLGKHLPPLFQVLQFSSALVVLLLQQKPSIVTLHGPSNGTIEICNMPSLLFV